MSAVGTFGHHAMSDVSPGCTTKRKSDHSEFYQFTPKTRPFGSMPVADRSLTKTLFCWSGSTWFGSSSPLAKNISL